MGGKVSAFSNFTKPSAQRILNFIWKFFNTKKAADLNSCKKPLMFVRPHLFSLFSPCRIIQIRTRNDTGQRTNFQELQVLALTGHEFL